MMAPNERTTSGPRNNHDDPDAGQPLEAIEAIEAMTENIILHV